MFFKKNRINIVGAVNITSSAFADGLVLKYDYGRFFSFNKNGNGNLMNQEEFKKFVEQHQHSLVATLFKLTGNWETARDIAQESFLRFWNRRSKLKKDKNPAFLLFRIGVNCCIDFLRSKKEKISGIEPSDDIFLQDEEAAGLYKDELFKIIHNCCKNLSEKQRFCFILRDLEGFLVEEITELLDISAESVRGNLHYARKKIRKILEEKHPIFFEDIL